MTANDSFKFEWHSNVLVITPASSVETMRWDLIEQAAEIVMAPISRTQEPMVVFDLGRVKYFGSVFLSLLLKCHKLAKTRGGEMVLCGVSAVARDLLRVTALDTLWAIYETQQEAIEAVQS